MENVVVTRKRKGKLRDYKDVIIDLYNQVKTSPFYSRDVKNVFPSERIHMLVMKGYLRPTGNYYIGDSRCGQNRRYNEWQFTKRGIDFVESWLGDIRLSKLDDYYIDIWNLAFEIKSVSVARGCDVLNTYHDVMNIEFIYNEFYKNELMSILESLNTIADKWNKLPDHIFIELGHIIMSDELGEYYVEVSDCVS